jgi:15-cis-phytoene synthase
VAHTDAFVAPNHVRSTRQESFQLPILQSLAAPLSPGSRSNRSETELDKEHDVASSAPSTTASDGKILEGGKVIDFQSLRGPSLAENALEEFKLKVARSTKGYGSPSTEILGINQSVVAEVGHELGTFATSHDIQNCAAYLRSLAAPAFFKQRTATAVLDGKSLPSPQKAEFDLILRQAYIEAGEVTSAFAKTFYLGTQLLPEASREAIWAIYVWCRRTDEIVDAPRDSTDEMLQDLGAWEMRLQSLWDFGEVTDVYELCLLDVLVKYPTLKIDPFKDMIRGMLMDVPQLGQDRYDSFNDLHLYCYRVAGTVGLMCLPVFGCAERYDEIIAK